jgi:predicted nucleic acid-binding protein
VQSVLVDTNIVSYIFRHDSRAVPYVKRHLNNRLWFISFMTQGELYRWPIRGQWGEDRRNRLFSYLAKYGVLESNVTICQRWADIMERKGFPIGDADAWIAATAIAYGLPLVTHNVKDFMGIPDLELLSL